MDFPWLDRVLLRIAPRWAARRAQARVTAALFQRHYEGAAMGRRTQGWNRHAGDANAANGPALGRLRQTARDLVRNNPYAANAVDTMADHTVGWGIVAKPARGSTAKATANRAKAFWDPWANTTACDADGRHDLAGLEKLVMRTVIESGECLVRFRFRRPEDDLPIPLQLQVLEADFLDDTMRDGQVLPGGGRIIQGVEFNVIGQRVAYWMHREHPGSALSGATFGQSDRIPADRVLHVFRATRPGQVRGASWFAPIMLRLREFDEYEDAALMKQKIAACLSVLTTDVNGTAPPVGKVDSQMSELDQLEPGMILNVPVGRTVNVVQPPTVSEHGDYAATTLRAIATGLGLTYEDLTGDYADMPFSAARMSRLRHWARVEDWRWRMLIPQFCEPVWREAMAMAVVMGLPEAPTAEWTASPAPMIEPDREGLAYQRNIRTGIMSLSEAIRERGYDPEELLTELSEDFKLLDRLGLRLDCDPRTTTQAGNPTETVSPSGRPIAAGTPSNGNGNGEDA